MTDEQLATILETIRREAHLTRCRMDAIEDKRLRESPEHRAEQAQTRAAWIEGR